jgi:Ca2+-binding EF-hand superfamily protein
MMQTACVVFFLLQKTEGKAMNNAEKQSLKNEIQKRITEKLGENYTVNLQQVYKTNISLDAITIFETKADCHIAPTIYLNAYYNDFSKGADVEDIVEKIIEVYEQNKNEEPINISEFLDFENIKSKIACKVINRNLNAKLLEDVPFDEFFDLAIVFYVVWERNEFGNASILIHNNHLNIWGISKEEISEFAYRNTPSLLGISIQSMHSIMAEMLRDDLQKEMMFEADDATIEEMLGQIKENEDGAMYVLTNSKKIDGAILMAYPEVLKEFALNHGIEKLVVIPSSVHECLLVVPEGLQSFEQFNNMVQEVNASQVAEDEILADHCYLYDLSCNKLSMI